MKFPIILTIFIFVKIIHRSPRPVYELEDLNGTLIEGQFYGEELTPVRVTRRSVYKLDKILGKRYRNGILEYLVHWKGYRKDFDSWVPAASVKNIWEWMDSSFNVTLFSNSSMKAYPDKTISAFMVQLAHEIDLGTYSWELALCEFSCPPPNVGTLKHHSVFYDTNALIYCDLITPQFVSHSKVRCLRIYNPPTAFCNEDIHPIAFCNEVFENLYLPVEKRTFRDITILIIDTVGNPIAFPDSKTPAKVVLHFRRVLQ